MKMGLRVVTSYSTSNATVAIKQETGEEILWDSTISDGTGIQCKELAGLEVLYQSIQVRTILQSTTVPSCESRQLPNFVGLLAQFCGTAQANTTFD
jgi:hypothetical protein